MRVIIAASVWGLVSFGAFADPIDDIEQGYEAYRAGNHSVAIEYYTKAISATGGLEKENLAIAYYNRGLSQMALGIYQKASNDFSAAIRLDPYDPEFYINRGVSYASMDDYDRAVRDYDYASSIAPEDPRPYSNKCWAMSQAGRYEEALTNCELALELFPNSALIHHNLGVVHDGLGNRDKAAESYRRALEMDPQMIPAQSDLNRSGGS